MAKSYSFSRQQAIEMLQDPAFAEQYTKGYLKGQALAQTVGETPMQPEVTAAAIQPEPQYIEPASTTYTGFTDQPMPDMPPQMAMAPDMPPQVPKQPSVFDEMQSAKSPKEQQRLLFKLMSQSMEQQQAGVRQAQEALRKEQERQAGLGVLGRLDLRPFTEALRSYGSTSVAQAQAPEMTEAQRQEFLRRLQAQVQGAQEGMTKEQVAALRTMMQDKKDAQADISRRNAEIRETKMVVDPLTKINSYGADLDQNLGQIESVINKKKIPVAELRQIVSKFGKIMGEVGTQTEGDVKRYFDPTIAAQFNIFLNKFNENGTIDVSDPSVQAMINQMQYSREEASKGIRRKAQYIRDTYGSPDSALAYQFAKGKPGFVAYSKAIEFADQLIMPRKPTEDKTKSAGVPLKPETAGAGGNKTSEEEKLKAELEALKR